MARRVPALVFGVVITLTACGDGTAATTTAPETTTSTAAPTTTIAETTTTTAAPTTTTTTLPERYSLSVRQGYLAGCESESPGGTYCICTLRELEKLFTEEEFLAWANTADESDLPPELFDVIVTCLDQADFGAGGEGVGRSFSDEIRESYLEGCESESPGGNFCVCTLELIEEQITEEEFIRFALEATEEPPAQFLEIALACLGEIDL